MAKAHGNGTVINGTTSDHARVPVSQRRRLYSLSEPPSLEELKKICSQTTEPETYPLASDIVSNIPVYDLPDPPSSAASSAAAATCTSSSSAAAAAAGDALDANFYKYIDRLQDEWHHIFLSGPGVVVLRNFTRDSSVISRATAVFDEIIAAESSSSPEQLKKKGDHFAASGSNARIWNSFQKHAERDPASFVRYYAHVYLDAVCQAWLGPGYQLTAQVNVVRPGGKPQAAHRDYHLGFQTGEACARFPRAAQTATQFLTLQGAVAHSDMGAASGPTRFLPFSQTFGQGFLAYRLPQFQAFFDERWVSCELRAGDAVFFNPALFHAAGENRTADVQRAANLLQVSSAFGRAMETVDSLAIVAKCWDEVRKLYAEERGLTKKVLVLLNAIAEAYPFPTNLDRRPPAPGGMAPESEVDVLRRGVMEGMDTEQVVAAITRLHRDSMA